MNLMTLKLVHESSVVLTFFSYSLRGFWMMIDSPLLQHKLTRILPHIIDTVLLLSGVTLAVMLYGNFYRMTWLMVKLGAVIVYIILGSIAIRYGRTKTARIIALIMAWCVFFFIVVLARYNAVLPHGLFSI